MHNFGMFTIITAIANSNFILKMGDFKVAEKAVWQITSSDVIWGTAEDYKFDLWM